MLQSAQRRKRREGHQADGRAGRAPVGRAGARTRLGPLLHGRGLAQSQGPDMPALIEMVKGVRAMGMETCMTLGMLTPKQAGMLADAGLDYYNHNIDTAPGELCRGHHHPHLRGPASTRSKRARGGHQRLLRRHRRHGRDARGPRRLHPCAGHACRIPKACRSTRWCRSRARYWATCWPTRRSRRSTRSSSCARWRWRASPCR